METSSSDSGRTNQTFVTVANCAGVDGLFWADHHQGEMGKSMSSVPPRLDWIDLWGEKLCLWVCRDRPTGGNGHHGSFSCFPMLAKGKGGKRNDISFYVITRGTILCPISRPVCPVALFIALTLKLPERRQRQDGRTRSIDGNVWPRGGSYVVPRGVGKSMELATRVIAVYWHHERRLDCTERGHSWECWVKSIGSELRFVFFKYNYYYWVLSVL